MNYLTHKIKIELNRCNEVMYLHLKIDIEESALKTNDVEGMTEGIKIVEYALESIRKKRIAGLMEKSCAKKKNLKISLNRPIISVVISKTGERVGVTRFPAPRHSIFLSVKRYQANCICPLHRGAEPDQTVFGPGYYSSLDIVGSRHHSLVSI